jgi:hypothetical protein
MNPFYFLLESIEQERRIYQLFITADTMMKLCPEFFPNRHDDMLDAIRYAIYGAAVVPERLLGKRMFFGVDWARGETSPLMKRIL